MPRKSKTLIALEIRRDNLIMRKNMVDAELRLVYDLLDALAPGKTASDVGPELENTQPIPKTDL